MGLNENDKRTLINLKIERAYETINEVKSHIEQGFYRTAINRMYYACYYIVSALLLQENLDIKTHKGIITLFSLNFIKTGRISDEFGKFYRNLFELRQTGDYDEFKVIDKDDVIIRLEPAKQFIGTIEKLIYENQ